MISKKNLISLVLIIILYSLTLKAEVPNPFPLSFSTYVPGLTANLNYDFDQNRFKQADGSFSISGGTKASNTIYIFSYIYGRDNINDTVNFSGNLQISDFNMGGGYNTVNLLEGTTISSTAQPNANVQSFKNINNLNISKNVLVEKLTLLYNDQDMLINLSGGKPGENKDIILGNFELISNGSKVKGTINISGEVNIINRALFSSNDETLNLSKGILNSNGDIDASSITILEAQQGISDIGGNNIINMGEFSQIKVEPGGNINLGEGNNIINMYPGSLIDSPLLLLEDGNNIVNIYSAGDNVSNNIYHTTIGNIQMGNGNNIIYLEKSSYLTVNGVVSFGNGDNNIIINNNSTINITDTASAANLNFGSGKNYIYLGENSKLIANINLSLGNNDTIVVDTNNSSTDTIVGNIYGSEKNNDTLYIIGNGNLNITSNSNNSLNNINNIFLDQANLNVNFFQSYSKDLNLNFMIKQSDTLEIAPRLYFNEGVDFDNNNIKLKITGVSRNLNKLGDTYNLILIRNGQSNDPSINSDTKLHSINLTSVLYKVDYDINNKDLNVTLTKCNTFANALSGNDICNNQIEKAAPIYVINIGKVLDNLLSKSNLPQKYYDVLDNLSMMNLTDLEKSLVGIMPINSEVFFNINQNVSDGFKNIIFNSKSYKIQEKDISFWTDYQFSNLGLNETGYSQKVNINANALVFGGEYSLLNELKVGFSSGYSINNISDYNSYYKGKSDSIYYGMYSFVNLTKNLTLRLNLSRMSGGFKLKKQNIFDNSIENISPTYYQMDFDSLIEYKVKFASFMVTPFISVGYSRAQLSKYEQLGDLDFSTNKSNAVFTKAGVGFNIITVQSIYNQIFIPSVQVLFNIKSQNISGQQIDLLNIDNTTMQMYLLDSNYGYIKGNIDLGLSYFINNYSNIMFNIGYTKGTNLESYRIEINLKVKL